MTSKNKLLTILSDIERYALYGLPDFDDGQQFEYLSLSEAELALACSRPSLYAQVYCVLQIGYFKAKHAFFRFTWDEVQEGVLSPKPRKFRHLCKSRPYAMRTPASMALKSIGFWLQRNM